MLVGIVVLGGPFNFAQIAFAAAVVADAGRGVVFLGFDVVEAGFLLAHAATPFAQVSRVHCSPNDVFF